ncbi:ABC-type dipeptide transport system, periplasmic component [Clostridium aceticum]|uniref:ABC-type dipeptide transport system, periplasmic component n=1 Tax=Clostridium aceticum TaxID=84022 RepID=A0A0D8IC49_9CLOT|nr:peptide ABC transporter substrate-binding protein [Clostridium aceticum]AKL94924.1 ABC-type dipeptide transport system, periplasmic component [Clostridium aceticum]KJF27843.1 hypothetical protein TZ02_04400 [Clostridium aceticum]
MGIKKYLAIFLIITMAFLMMACDTEEVEEQLEDEEEIIENYEPADGGTLKVSVTRFNTLNPIYNSKYSLFQLQHLIYEGLLTFDQNMNVNPLLAESWRIAEDGQSLEMTLRQNVTWHDGTPFTAEDVIFTINLIKGNIRNATATSTFRQSLQLVSDVKEVREGIILINFSRPISNNLEMMTFPILPQHLFEGNNISKINATDFPIIGTGPYQLKEYETMRSIKLMRNSNYWGQKPYIEEVQAVIVPDLEAQLAVFENGDIDLVQPTSIDWAKYTENRRMKVYEYVSHDYEFLGFNFRNPLLQDKNIRQAIAYGIDRHKLINNIYLGHGTVVDVPVYPLSGIYDEASLRYGYNSNQALELLNNSGYSYHGQDNIQSNENGNPLIFTLITNKENILREKTAFFIEDELEKLGIKINVEILEWEEYNERINRGNFDLMLGGWELSYLPDLSFAFHSSRVGGSNFISYRDEEMDQLIEASLRATAPVERQQAYSDLQQHIVEELPYASLFFRNGAIAVRDRIKGDFAPNNYNLFNGIEGWFINTK